MVVTVDPVTNRAVKLKGDPDHPFTAGYPCAKVNHYLDRVYHPDRLKYPMRRVGPKGEGLFERISWDEAIRIVAKKLKAVAAEIGPQAILPYSYAGTMGKLQGRASTAGSSTASGPHSLIAPSAPRPGPRDAT